MIQQQITRFKRTKTRPLTKKERIKLALLDPRIAIREKCKRDFYFFFKYFWDIVSNEELKDNWHIEYLCKEAQKVVENVAKGKPKEYDLIINVPPGTSKTTIVSIMLPVWAWTNYYHLKFITASYSGALALEAAEASRDLIRSEKFRQIFPDIEIKQDKDTKSNFRIVKKEQYYPGRPPRQLLGGNRYSTSVGGTLTGFHGHILICDDLIDPYKSVSQVELDKANRWFSQTLSTRKVDKEVTPIILIQQRLHQNDPTGYLLKQRKGKKIRHISIPGEIVTFKENVNPPELVKYYKDGLMDPIRMSWEVLKDLEADLGQYGYASQIGQNPIPIGGGMFKVEHFQIVDNLPAQHDILQKIRYWDKAGTVKDDSPYTVGVKMYKIKVFENTKYLVVDVKRGRWEASERETIIKETAQVDGRDVVIYVEQEPGSGGKESAQSTIRNLAGFVVHADRPTGDKVYRADPYSVQVNYGNVLLLRGEWNHDFIEEHKYFPLGTYKDQVDAAAGAFNKLVAKKEAKVF